MPEIIRQGDPTSHGGKVLEGSLTDLCHGKPIAYMGHRVSCPKCRGTFPIVEGVQTTTFYGKGVAVAGMKTACGATLMATQFTDTVDYAGGPAQSTSPAPATATAAATTVASSIYADQDARGGSSSYDEQAELPAKVAEGIPYLIVGVDGKKFAGRADGDGRLPRVFTEAEAEYYVYWGDEALARMEE